jgi:hypothetical protein
MHRGRVFSLGFRVRAGWLGNLSPTQWFPSRRDPNPGLLTRGCLGIPLRVKSGMGLQPYGRIVVPSSE